MPDFSQEAEELFGYTRSLRRDLHRNPELGFQEFRTAGIVAGELNKLGLETHTGIAETGVVGLMEGVRPGPVVLMRFDMDALPIEEETGAEYASQTSGVMHACGHDGHTAIGLTVARILNGLRAQFEGTVKLVFQPAEEGLGGARRMVAEGVLENPRPDHTLALHLWNNRPLGWIGVPAGPVMAASERFRVSITGKGGHAASPHQTRDSVLAAAQAINALQSIVSRNVPPLESAVVSVGSIHGGETYNVIPPHVTLEGTIRTFDQQVREHVVERFEALVRGVVEAMGCQADILVEHGTPAVVNDPQASEQVRAVVSRVLPQCTLDFQERTMGSEDMAYLMAEVPGCYFLVGSANSEKGLDYGHHHPKFDIDERALPAGVALMAAAAYDLLRTTDPS